MSNATSVHVRRPGNAKKWKATVLCEAKSSDLALLTVEEDLFWQDDLREVKFVDVPDLQVGLIAGVNCEGCDAAIDLCCGVPHWWRLLEYHQGHRVQDYDDELYCSL